MEAGAEAAGEERLAGEAVEGIVGDVAPETVTEQELREEAEASAGQGPEAEASLVFHALCAADKYDAVRKALRKGQDVNGVDHFGRTALHAACLHGKEDMVSLLLKAGGDPDADDERFGNTALHLAASNGSSECVALLLSHGADVDAQNEKGLTPIMAAARAGHEEVVRVLASHAEFLEHHDEKGWTALHYAAWHGMATGVAALLEAGSDPRQATKDCRATALEIAETYAHAEAARVLVKWQAEHKRADMEAKLL